MKLGSLEARRPLRLVMHRAARTKTTCWLQVPESLLVHPKGPEYCYGGILP